MTVKAVFFDIGNVLLKFDAAKIVRKIAWELRANPLKIALFMRKTRLVDPIERGEISPEALYAMFQEKLGFKGDQKAFRLLWCDHFTVQRATANLLKAVAKTRKVYLLSNTNLLHYEFIRERYAFAGQVHGAVLSYELKLRKPEPEIYLAALKMAGVEPQEAVFIDDLKENVEGARKVGITALHYTGSAALKKELKDLGVL